MRTRRTIITKQFILWKLCRRNPTKSTVHHWTRNNRLKMPNNISDTALVSNDKKFSKANHYETEMTMWIVTVCHLDQLLFSKSFHLCTTQNSFIILYGNLFYLHDKSHAHKKYTRRHLHIYKYIHHICSYSKMFNF